jgi:hypothetical protein
LLQLGASNLSKIFHAEISMGLLGDFLCALNSGFQSEHSDSIVDILLCLSEVNRFQLSLQFLSSDERKQCSELNEKLLQNVERANDLKMIAAKF